MLSKVPSAHVIGIDAHLAEVEVEVGINSLSFDVPSHDF